MLKSIFLLHSAHLIGRLLYVFFALWYLNRFLGVEAKGLWAGLFSLFSILSVFSNMGFEIWLSRAVASDTIDRRRARNLLFQTKSGLWVLCWLIGAVLVYRGAYPVLATIAFGVALIFDGIGVAQQAVYEGRSDTPRLAAMSFFKVGGFALVAAVAAMIVPDPSLNLFAWCFAGVLGMRVCFGHHAWRLLPDEPKPRDKDAARSFLFMGAYTLVTVLYFRIDQVMLLSLAGEAAAGNYANAYDLIEGTLFISGAVAAVVYPRLVQCHDEQRRARLFDTAFLVLTVVAACGVSGMWLFGRPVGTLLAGKTFESALPVLYLLACSLPIMFANGILSRWLFARNMERFALISGIVATIINIAGNAWAIPRWGAWGAAVMTVATEGFIFAAWLLVGRGSAALLLRWCGLLLPLLLIHAAWRHVGMAAAMLLAALVYAPLGLYFARALQRTTLEPAPRA